MEECVSSHITAKYQAKNQGSFIATVIFVFPMFTVQLKKTNGPKILFLGLVAIRSAGLGTRGVSRQPFNFVIIQ